MMKTYEDGQNESKIWRAIQVNNGVYQTSEYKIIFGKSGFYIVHILTKDGFQLWDGACKTLYSAMSQVRYAMNIVRNKDILTSNV